MTPTLKLPRDQVAALRPRDVQLYLVSRGWIPDPAESSPDAALFRQPDLGDAEVLLPLRRELGDYVPRMSEAVLALAVVERRSPLEVLSDLSGPPSDVLRLRVSAPDATLGNLPLDEGLQLLRGGRDMLLSAACSTIRPQAFHPEMSLKQPNDFIKSCRLGQTERGSFVATIITPVPPALHQENLPGLDGFVDVQEPFARRVTTRLMSSLEIVDDAVRSARLDPILGGIENGVSANLCEAMVAMRPEGDQSRLDISMSWSRSRPRVPDHVPKIVSFAQEDFPIIEEAGRQLRERARPRRERFEGKVQALQSDIPSLYDDLIGKIIIRTTVGGRSARVKVVLNHDDYRRACDAHRDEKRVAVTGLIHHDVKVRVYELSEPRDFEVLEEE
jgi:hypothetical protein